MHRGWVAPTGRRRCMCRLIKVMRFAIAVIGLAVLLSGVAAAQAIEYASPDPSGPLNRALGELHHVAYGERDNSPTSAEFMTQDRHGFLWLGTERGVMRFDGERFMSVFDDLHLPNRTVLSLFIDSNDGFWVGYSSGGLVYVSPKHIARTFQEPAIPGGSVFAIVQGPRDQLWIATVRGVARRVDDAWVPVGSDMGYDGHQPENMNFVGGTLRIIDVDGVWKLPPGADRFIKQDRQEAIDDEWKAVGTPSRLYNLHADGEAMVDSSGALWVAVEKGFERLRWVNDSAGKPQRLTETFTKKEGLSGDNVARFFEDREHNVWVLTEGGIDKFQATKFRPLALPGNIANPSLTIGSDNTLWITSSWEPSVAVTGQDVAPLERFPQAARATLHDQQGRIWTGGSKGLFISTGNAVRKIDLPPDLADVGSRFQALGLGPAGDLWIAASGFDLYRMMGDRWQKEAAPPFPDVSVIRMASEANGNLWLACTKSTLVRVTASAIRVYDHRDGLDAGTLKSITFGRSVMWVGGDEGLFVKRAEHFMQLRGEGGEAFRSVTSIVESDDGDLWLAGMDGVYQIAASEVRQALDQPSHPLKYQQFYREDGLISIRNNLRPLPSLLQTANKHIWYSSDASVSWIDPDRILRNPVPPGLSIDGVSEGGRFHQATAQIEVPANPGRVEIAFAAASYANPQRVLFHYRLDGVDDHWQQTRERHVAYTNLGPGTYKFRIKAVNEDGVENTQDVAINLAIAAAWYQTPAFRVATLVLAIVSLLAAYVIRSKYLQARVLAGVEARHQERERIARDLHDTLLQDIQGLLFWLQGWADDLTLPGHVRRDLRQAADRARHTLAEGRDRISDLRLATKDGLAERLRDCGVATAEKHGIYFYLTTVGPDPRLSPSEQCQIVEVANEALRNACIHSQGSTIHVDMRNSFRGLRVTISDDGVGISPEILRLGRREGHWGLDGMRERIKSIGGRIAIHSRPQQGTRIEIHMPWLRLRSFRQ